MLAMGPMTNDRSDYSTVTENLICDKPTQLGRIAVNASVPTFHPMVDVTVGGDWRFLAVGDEYILAYDTTGTNRARVLHLSNIKRSTYTGGWSMTAASTSVYTMGVLWSRATAYWKDMYAFIKRSDAWTGPYKITAVNGVTGYLTFGTAYSGTTGIADDMVIMGSSYVKIPTPTTAPSILVSTAAGSITGDGYQYAYTYGTVDGFESAPSPWSASTGAISSKNVLVYGFGYTETILAGTMIDRINVYRRGGTHGDYEQYAGTHYIYSRYVETTGVVAVPSVDTLDGQVTAGDSHCHLVAEAIVPVFPEEGIIALVNSAGDGVIDEYIHYTSKTPPTTGSQLNFSGTAVSTHVTGKLVVLDYYTDSTADSSLSGRELRYDHECPNDYILHAAQLGERLVINCKNGGGNTATDNDRSRVYISSMSGWRYFLGSDNLTELDDVDETLATYRDIGNSTESVTALATFLPNITVVYKSDSAYILSGRSTWGIRIEKATNIPGADNDKTILVHDAWLFWTKGTHCWLWNGSDTIMDIALPIADQITTTECAFSHDNQIYLLQGSSGKYVCWDFRHQWQLLGTNLLAPTPIIGTGVGIEVACVGTNYNSDGVIYGAISTDYDVFALFGTGLDSTDRFDFDLAAAPNMQITLPSFAVKGGAYDAVLEHYYVYHYSPSTPSATTLTVTPTYDNASMTPFSHTLDNSTGTYGLYQRVSGECRGYHVGMSLSSTLSSLANNAKYREIENIVVSLGSVKRRTI
jgi:hypothetical protein